MPPSDRPSYEYMDTASAPFSTYVHLLDDDLGAPLPLPAAQGASVGVSASHGHDPNRTVNDLAKAA